MQWLTPREVQACVLAGLLVAAVAMFALPPVQAAACGVLFAITAAIALIDARAFVIPDALLIPAAIAGMLARLVAVPGASTLLDCLSGAVLSGGSFYLLRYVYGLLRHREGLGLGDVKLAAVAGIWLPLGLLPVWVLIAACVALVTALGLMVQKGQALSGTAALPFGTFLAPSLWIVWAFSTMFGGLFPDLPL